MSGPVWSSARSRARVYRVTIGEAEGNDLFLKAAEAFRAEL